MRIILTPNEINEAITNIINQHINIKENQSLNIKVRPVKGVGLVAEVEITDHSPSPALPNLFPNLIKMH